MASLFKNKKNVSDATDASSGDSYYAMNMIPRQLALVLIKTCE